MSKVSKDTQDLLKGDTETLKDTLRARQDDKKMQSSPSDAEIANVNPELNENEPQSGQEIREQVDTARHNLALLQANLPKESKENEAEINVAEMESLLNKKEHAGEAYEKLIHKIHPEINVQGSEQATQTSEAEEQNADAANE